MTGVVLATDIPHDRSSLFYNDTWLSQNRASSDLYTSDKYHKRNAVDFIEPGQVFYFRLVLDARNLKPGDYTEHFSIVMEDLCWVTGSLAQVLIHVRV